MNYYSEIKIELINNEIYKRVKDYSKNRNDKKVKGVNHYKIIGIIIAKRDNKFIL